MKINLHIDRITLHGMQLSAGERHELHGTVERELGRLLQIGTDQFSGPGGQHVDLVSASDVRLTAEISPQHLGRSIATSIYGGIQK